MHESNTPDLLLRSSKAYPYLTRRNEMTYFIAPSPYRMARRWARQSDCEQPVDSRRFTLGIDLREEDEAYVLTALVPGLKAEDLSIQVLEDVVTIEGEFKTEGKDYLLNEIPHGAFRRTLRLPSILDATKAQARISEGILTLTLPRAESSKPKTIKINVK
jgi:HSP20 family protein